jgi:hypothetical protein
MVCEVGVLLDGERRERIGASRRSTQHNALNSGVPG